MVGKLQGRARRKVAAATAGGLLSKTFQLSNEVYLAMQSRGFSGEVYLLSDFDMKPFDYAGMVVLLGLSTAAVWWGR
jgi:cobalt/nickel transport system permease protein